ncbi:MAG: hypothetical protein KF830_03310 [Planctomycetes bacterium]|nr:hypothetical protein [Planctomycetota bacterium]
MSYDPRTIAFTAEILHPPQPPRADLAQSLHNTLYRQPAIGYQNFQVAPDGIHLTNLPQAPGQISAATLTWDRLVLREELRGSTVEDFATRVVNVTSTAFQTLGLVTSLAQQFVVRSLVQPRHFRDGREFLSRRLIAPGNDAWQALGRPLQSLGIRLVLPPPAGSRGAFQVRIESWPQDPRSLWLENTGSFTGPIAAGDAPQLAELLYETYRYLTGPVAAYLAALDTP